MPTPPSPLRPSWPRGATLLAVAALLLPFGPAVADHQGQVDDAQETRLSIDPLAVESAILAGEPVTWQFGADALTIDFEPEPTDPPTIVVPPGQPVPDFTLRKYVGRINGCLDSYFAASLTDGWMKGIGVWRVGCDEDAPGGGLGEPGERECEGYVVEPQVDSRPSSLQGTSVHLFRVVGAPPQPTPAPGEGGPDGRPAVMGPRVCVPFSMTPPPAIGLSPPAATECSPLTVLVDPEFVAEHGGMTWPDAARALINSVNDIFEKDMGLCFHDSKYEYSSALASEDPEVFWNQIRPRTPEEHFIFALTHKDMDGAALGTGEHDTGPTNYWHPDYADGEFHEHGPHKGWGQMARDAQHFYTAPSGYANKVQIIAHELGHMSHDVTSDGGHDDYEVRGHWHCPPACGTPHAHYTILEGSQWVTHDLWFSQVDRAKITSYWNCFHDLGPC